MLCEATVFADGIILPVDEFGGDFGSETTVQVSSAALPGTVTGAPAYDWTNAVAYNVRAMREGAVVTPSQALSFRLTPPSGADPARCAVFLLDGGSATLCASSVSSGTLLVSSQTMGLYAVAQRNPLLGDINGDWLITDMDRTLLARYLADWDVAKPDDAVADINSDGRVNAVDRVILARYLAGWGDPYDAYFA